MSSSSEALTSYQRYEVLQFVSGRSSAWAVLLKSCYARGRPGQAKAGRRPVQQDFLKAGGAVVFPPIIFPPISFLPPGGKNASPVALRCTPSGGAYAPRPRDPLPPLPLACPPLLGCKIQNCSPPLVGIHQGRIRPRTRWYICTV